MSNYHKMSVPTIPINAKNVSWHILITPKKNVYIYILYIQSIFVQMFIHYGPCFHKC